MNKNITFKREKLNVYTLHSALSCQRDIDEKHAKTIEETWCDGCVELIKVSVRNGENRIIGGQHTVKEWIRRIELGQCNTPMIECNVARGMEDEDEFEWFMLDAKEHKPQSAKDVYEARVSMKTDESINSLISDLSKCNLFIKVYMPSGNNVIEAIDTIEKIHNAMEHTDFINCFSLLQQTWSGDIESLRASFIKGMVKFYVSFNSSIDNNRFKTSLVKYTPKSIKIDADADKLNKDVGIKYARVMTTYYNKGLSKNRQLKIGRLED